MIAHIIEELQVKSIWRRSLPQTESIHGICVKTDHRHIIRRCSNFLSIFDVETILAIWSFTVFDFATEFNGYGKVTSLDFPRVAVFEPVVRIFNLIAVFDFLLEHTVLVADSVAVSRVIQSCKRIQETSRQSTETTITQSGVRLFVFDKIDVDVHVIEDFFDFFFNSKIDEIVAQSSSHQEFSRKIIQLLCRLFLIGVSCCHPSRHNQFLN